MANKIQLRRGLSTDLPALSEGEPGFTTDTKRLYVGTSGGNANLTGTQIHRGISISGTSYTNNAYKYEYFPTVKPGDIYLNTYTGGLYYCSNAPDDNRKTQASWSYIGPSYGARALANTGLARTIMLICSSLMTQQLQLAQVAGLLAYTNYDSIETTMLNKVFILRTCYQQMDTICNKKGGEVLTLKMFDDEGANGVYIEPGEAALIYVTKVNGDLQAYVLAKSVM